MAQKKPAFERRLGRLRVVVWENESDQGELWFNVQIKRLYRDGETWNDTDSFRRDDLPIVSKLADMAYAWIWSEQSSQVTAGSEGSEQ